MNVHLEPITVTQTAYVQIPKAPSPVLARADLQEMESPVLVGVLHIFSNSYLSWKWTFLFWLVVLRNFLSLFRNEATGILRYLSIGFCLQFARLCC